MLNILKRSVSVIVYSCGSNIGENLSYVLMLYVWIFTSSQQSNTSVQIQVPGAHSEHSTLSVSFNSKRNHRPLNVPWGIPKQTQLCGNQIWWNMMMKHEYDELWDTFH